MTEDHALMHPSRQIGRLGTATRIALGSVLLAVPFVVGDAPGWLDAALGLLALPAAVLSFLWLRARRKPQRLAATGFGGYTINFGIGAVLLAVPLTREAAFFFYGASMLLAAARGYAGCELFAIPNWLLRREDEIGCPVFGPVDAVERERTG